MKEQECAGPTGSPAENTTTTDMIFEEAVKAPGLTNPTTGSPISPTELITVLKEDVVFAFNRPSSWEGSDMTDVLICHGFLRY